MVRGGAEGEVTALLAHVDGVVQPSVARVAVRGVVGILVRGAHPSPLHVLRRCLVGVPCAAVDEVAGASAALVLAGAVDADAMVGELIAALAASAAAAAERAPRPSRADASGTGVSADAASAEASDAAHVAAALVRGVGLVVAASMGGPHPAEIDSRDPGKDWAGPAHPLARALRAFPGAAAAPAMDAVAAALGDGPDSAAALSRAPRRVAFARLRPFLRYALLSDSAALRDTGFAQALHARLVRLACAGGALAAPAAELVADCLPWYRGVPRGVGSGSAGARDAARAAARDAWLSTACADVADAVESAFLETTETNELSSDAGTLASAAARAAEACVARLAERDVREPGFGPGWSAATLGSARRLLAVATATRDDGSAFLGGDGEFRRTRFASLACDVGALVPGAAARHAGEAAALVSLLARFFAGPRFCRTKAKDANVSGGSGETEGGSGAGAIPDEEEEALVGRRTAAAAVVAARVASALGLPPARGGRLAATLATPPRRSASSLFETERFRKRETNRRAAGFAAEMAEKTETFRATCASPDAALAHALEPLWHDDDQKQDTRGTASQESISARLLRALEADGAADDARVAAERRRRRAKTGRGVFGTEYSSERNTLVPPSVAPPTLPLVLLAHPSSAVREGAARALAERVAAVPERAPAALPPLLARLRADSLAFGLKADAADALDARSARAEAKALLAGLRAVAAGAAHPLGAPVAARALAPLVEPLETETREGKTKPFFHESEKENGGVADPRARALALRLLAELWKHHRGSFPRLKSALEHAVTSSPEPEVLVGAAAACAFCADADPYAATELAGPLRACLSPSAPPAAAALALEAVASLCEADALDFYAALKVVVTRPHLAARPAHPLVASRWVALMGGGGLDAEARPEAAAAAVAAAFAATRAGLDADAGDSLTAGSLTADSDRWVPTRAAAFDALAKYDPATLLEPPPRGEDEEEGEAPAPGGALALALLREPSRFGRAVDAGVALLQVVTRHEQSRQPARGPASSASEGRRRGDAFGAAGGLNTHTTTRGAHSEKAAATAASVAALAARDPLLHRVMKATPRRLRTMPRLAGGPGDRDAAARGVGVGPAGAGAHLLLFRPADSLPEAAGEDAAGGLKGSLAHVRAALRDRADAHRRAFRTVAVSLPSPPASWRWHVGLTHKSCARFAGRWLDAELEARLGAAGAEAEGDALAEARASVAETALVLLRDAGPDAAQIAAAVLAAPALARDAAAAERATDALLARLAQENGASDGAKVETDGAERSAAVALGVVAGACHPGDRERRARAAAALRGLCAPSLETGMKRETGNAETSRRKTSPGALPAADPAAAAEALGMFARSLGASVAKDGPGAGAWRTEMLAEQVAFLRRAYRARQDDPSGGFALGLVLAAVAADACARAGTPLDFETFDFETLETLETLEGLPRRETSLPTGYDSAARALEALTRRLERGVDGTGPGPGADAAAAAAAAGAARAAPTAAAAALAAGAPCDALALRALRAATRGAAHVSSDARERPSRECCDLRVACLASAGALLHVALSAGVAVPRAEAAAAVAAAAAPLAGSGSAEAAADAATHAAGALGLAAALGGSWCLAGVGVAADAPNAGLGGGLDGGGRRGKEPGGETSDAKGALAAPLLWGDAFGAAQARAALRALEAAASAEGTAAAGGGSVALRAREAAAWGLALAADAAVARAGAASGTAADGTAAARGPASAKGSAASDSARRNAAGALADAVLTGYADETRGGTSAEAAALAAARALRVLAPLERLPAGDWPGALRRLARAAAALETEGGADALETAGELRDACAALAARHAGPGVGGAFLETALGEVSSHLSLPPCAVLERLGACVAALPPSRAEEALRRVAAAAAQAQARLPETEAALSAASGDGVTRADAARTDDARRLRRALDALRATWCGLLRAVDPNASLAAYLPRRADDDAFVFAEDVFRDGVEARAFTEKKKITEKIFQKSSSRNLARPTTSEDLEEDLPAGPWSFGSVTAAASSLAAALPRAAGAEMDLAVAGTRALFDAGVSFLPRAAARAADAAAPAAAAEAFRARLVAHGALVATDATPLSAWTPHEGRVDRFRALANGSPSDFTQEGAFFSASSFFLLDAAADGAEALAAATDASWAIGRHIAESKNAGSDRARFPASAVAALERLDASGDGAAAAAAAAAVFEAAAGGSAAAAAAARALRHRVSDEAWERLAWRLE